MTAGEQAGGGPGNRPGARAGAKPGANPGATPQDPVAFRAAQQQAWDEAAPGWQRGWHVLEAGAQPLNARLVELAQIAPGSRVLDLATGSGEPALTAARRVFGWDARAAAAGASPAGRVLALDLSEQMLALARERARAQGFGPHQVEFRQADAEDLLPALGGERFDVALCRWGLMLLRDPAATCRALLAALRPGGLLVAAVWSEAHEAPFFGVPLAVAQEQLGTPPPAAGTPGALALGKPGQLAGLMSAAGFVGLHVERFTVALRFPSAAEHVAFLRDVSGTMRKALADQPPEAHERVWAGIVRADDAYAQPDGAIVFENVVHCVAGRRPGASAG